VTNNVASRVTTYMRKESASSGSKEESKVITSIVTNEEELKRAKEVKYK